MSNLNDTIYALTSFQEGMLAYSEENTKTTNYLMQNIIDMVGKVNVSDVRSSLHLLAKKHEILMTNIFYDKYYRPMQKICRDLEIELEVINLIEFPKAEQENKLELILKEDRDRGFILSKDLLFRVKLILLSENHSKLILSYHHIILDSNSISLLCRDFIKYYGRLQEFEEIAVTKQGIEEYETEAPAFVSYVNYINKKDDKEDLKYWKNILEGYSEVSNIPSLKNTQIYKNQLKTDILTIQESDMKKLEEMAESLKVPMGILLKAVWTKILSLYNNSRDILFGNVISGREEEVEGIHDMVGVFIKTLPLRVSYTDKTTIKDLIYLIYKKEQEMKVHSHCSLAQIQGLTEQKSDLFRTIFVYEEYLEADLYNENCSSVQFKIENSSRHTTYDISVASYSQDGILKVNILYDPKRYAAEGIEALLKQFETIVKEIVRDSSQLVDELDYIGSEEKNKILNIFNKNIFSFDEHINIVNLFEKQAMKNGDKTALIFENTILTYKDLDEKSNQLAWKLIHSDIKKGDFVALAASRSIEMIVGILGILKIGGVYIPIDAAYPQERIQYMLFDSQPKVILHYHVNIDTSIPKVDLASDEIWSERRTNPNVAIDAGDLAYIIYTSGTTGNPKGVMVAHKGIVNLQRYFKEKYEITSQDTIAQFANLVFDASIWEISMALLNGASLVIVPDFMKEDTHKLAKYFEEIKVSVATLPPNYYLQTEGVKLRLLITAGSESSQSILDKAGEMKYINAYGPTETTICATDWSYNPHKRKYQIIPIGKPIDNMQVYIMNKDKLAGLLVPGELCIGGIGVALGYLNKEELTHEKFIKNPFGIGMLYRSGDMARWLPDGTIEFMGRMDSQIKIRGFRVELGEIESKFREIEMVQDAAVILREDNVGDKVLCAYIVTNTEEDMNVNRLKSQLRKMIPEYMIPAYIHKVKSIPVNQSGKVDTKALPYIEITCDSEYVSPRNYKEEVLCSALEKVLGLKQISVLDSFSALGGDSIKAIRLVSQLRIKGYEISVRDIMKCNIIESIAERMNVPLETQDYEQGIISGTICTTPILKMFEQWNLKKPYHFNQDVMITLDLREEEIVKEAITAVVLHHDMLRAVYRNNELSILDNIANPMYGFSSYDLLQEDYITKEVESICTSEQGSFNLENGPLFKAILFRFKKSACLFLCAHHLIIDGVSWRILIEDILSAIKQKENGSEIILPKKTASFKMWSEALEEYKVSKQLQKEFKYWKRVVDYAGNRRNIIGEQISSQTGYDSIEFKFDRSFTEKFMHHSIKAFGTNVYDLLVAGLGMTFAKYDNQDSLTLILESHGREEIHKRIDIDRTVGWFTAVYPVIIEYKNNIEDSIIFAKEALHNVPKHGFGYGFLKDNLNPIEEDVYFNYLGQLDGENADTNIQFNSLGNRTAPENGIIGNMNISVIILNHELCISMKYKKSWCNRTRAEEFMSSYYENLSDIAQFCNGQIQVMNTPSDYSAQDLSVKDYRRICESIKELGKIQDIFSLVPMQEGLLFEYQKNTKTTEYVIQQVIQLKEYTREDLLQKAFSLCVYRHDALRTVILYEELDAGRQVILKDRQLEYEYIDLSQLSKEEQKEQLSLITREDVERGFDLQRDILFRAKYVYFGDGISNIILCFHHIIIDGWSQSIIFNSMIDYYNMLVDGAEFEELKNQITSDREKVPSYSQYLQRVEHINREEGLEFWRDYVSSYEEISEIKPLLKPEKTPVQAAEEHFTLSEVISEQLYQVSLSDMVTLSTIVETGWGIVLMKYNKTNEAMFGKVVSGRDIPLNYVEEMVGLFINTVPVRVNAKNMTVGKLLQEMQRQNTECLNYGYNSLADIQNMSKLKGNLFQTLLVFENHIEDDKLEEKEIHLPIEMVQTREQTSYSLTILARYINKTLQFDIIYNPNTYKREEIKWVGERLKGVLASFAHSLNQTVAEVSMLMKEEEVLIRNCFNKTSFPFPKHKTVIEVFEEQVIQHPNSIFAVYKDISITYEDFNKKVNQIAWKLRNMGIKPNDFVAIIAERSIEMLIGIYGIIKSGAAYVPIDPAYPEYRINYIIKDCQPKAVLLYHSTIHTEVPCIDLENDSSYTGSCENPLLINQPEDRLYLIYTSGTTGNPKGVINKHIGVVNLFHWLINQYHITAKDSFLFKTTYIFDVSVSEILMPAFAGVQLVVAPKDAEKEPATLLHLIEDKGITLVNFVPSMLGIFLQSAANFGKNSSLRYIFAAGEALNISMIKDFYKLAEKDVFKAQLINLYGPTEASIYATHYTCSIDMDRSLIGQPLGNLQVFIVNENELCGVGVPGELCIAGYGVADGYLNQTELTNKKFVFNRYSEGLMYRTGDLARWMPDGNIEYLGRMDEQVKVRGFRIEIGEIESCLRELEEVKEAAVILGKRAGDNTIFAYVTSDIELDINSIKGKLAKKLPDYMIPSYLLQIKEMPITVNGKLDKRALPRIEEIHFNDITLPRTELERQLCNFYKEILEIEQIGIDDNFFDCGGHSLSVMKLFNQIISSIGTKVTIGDLFVFSTVRKLAEHISKNEYREEQNLPLAEQKELYAMSPAQKRIYIVSHLDKSGKLYNMPIGYMVKGNIDSDKIIHTLKTLTKRHEILRTTFHIVDSNFYQKVSDEIKIDYDFIEEVSSTEKVLMAEFVQPFQLDKAPLFRTRVIKREGYFLILFDMHHIISDGISLNLFLKEFGSIYNGLDLVPLRVQYKEYSEWFQNLDLTNQKDFWLKTIGDSIPVLNMPLDKKRPEQQSHRGNIIKSMVDGKTLTAVKSLAKMTGATEYMIFTSALMVLLSKYSYQEEVIVGSPIGGRLHKDAESMLGVFINTIPIKGTVRNHISYREFLMEMKEYCIKAYEHQEYPFELLVEDLNITRDMSRNPLFDVMLTYHNTKQFDLDMEGVQVYPLEQQSVVSKFDLDFTIMENEEGYSVWLEYCVDLFSEENINRILTNYIKLIEDISKKYDYKISDINFLTEQDKEAIHIFNHSEVEYAKNLTPIDYIEENAKWYPNRIAVVSEGLSLSYKELDYKAQVIACKLNKLGVKANDLVAIIADRSLELIVGVCGVLKAGGAYVPIDNTYPRDRIEYILEDCKPKAVLIYKYDTQVYENIINLEDSNLWEEEIWQVNRNSKGSDLLYCIYTSGTSGRPKGVLIEQEGVVNLCTNFMNNIFNESQVNIVGLMASYAFDSSVKMIFTSLMCGKTLHIISNQRKDNIQGLLEYIKQNHIEAIDFTPSYLRLVQSYVSSNKEKISLRVILAGGEELRMQDLDLSKSTPDLFIYNVYGPTEATVDATAYRCTGEEAYRIPIGSPIANVKVYIINNGNICGIGVPGELCIAGIGVARGYLNQPELTNEKFVPNPFGDGKMYKSGDLARWNADGTLEFMGRIDEQVKVRGYRIELNEISQTIKEIPGVKDGTVLVNDDENGSKLIYAFIVADIELDLEEIKRELELRLPSYMVPNYIRQIMALPVTTNGKIDKKALLSMKNQTIHNYYKPNNPVEIVLCNVFEEVLNEKNISIRDSFFELGGDSIKAIIIVSRLKSLGYIISVRDIMSFYTIEKIAPMVTMESKEEYSQSEVTGYINTTPILQDFINRNLPKPNLYCQDLLIEVEQINEKEIRTIWDSLVEHHDILRSVYREDKLFIQSKQDWSGYELSVIEINKENSETQVAKACRAVVESFDLWKGPLIKLILFEQEKGSQLFVCVHHLIIDGVSWRILLEDFNHAASQIKRGKTITLPMKTASYKDWAEALEEFKTSHLFQADQEYWRQINQSKEAGRLSVVKENTGKSSHYKKLSFELSEQETNLLHKEANRAYSTRSNDLLMSALTMAVKEVFQQDKVTVFMEGHGREELHKKIDVTRTVGWFTTKYPVILSCYDEIEMGICSTKDTLHQIPGNGLGYGLISKENQEEKGDIYFNYLGNIGDNLQFCEVGNRMIEDNGILGVMDINGMVVQGRLIMQTIFDLNVISEDLTTAFMKTYEKILSSIISHCVSHTGIVKTASDYIADNMSLEELKYINQFNKNQEVKEICPLTPMQEGILYHKISEPDSSAYVVQVVFGMDKGLDVSSLRKAIQQVMLKYPILRTSFLHHGVKQPRQVVLHYKDIDLEEVDLSNQKEADGYSIFTTLKAKAVDRNFDIQKDTLIRFQYVQLPDHKYKLIITHHHIILDGWCLPILMKDIEDFYNQIIKGTDFLDLDWHEQEDPFVDYLAQLSKQDMKSAYEYWDNLLCDYEGTGVIKRLSSSPLKDSNVKKVEVPMSQQFSSELINIAGKLNITASTIFETAWGLLLLKHNYSDDVVFGKVVSGRSMNIKNMDVAIGPFVNTIPVRLKYKGNEKVSSLLKDMSEQGVESVAYSYAALAEIQNHTIMKNQLIRTLYVFENYYVAADKSLLDNSGIFCLEEAREQTNYDLTVSVYYNPLDTSYHISLMYDNSHYCDKDMEWIISQYKNILQSMADNIHRTAENIQIVTEREKELIACFNQTKTSYASNQTVMEVFEEQVKKTPYHIAIVYKNKQLTYMELNYAVNRLAHKLQKIGVEKETLVMIMAEKSLETIIGICAILKSGGAYVPIDPNYPNERIQYMINDCNPKAILLRDRIFDSDVLTINLNDIFSLDDSEENPVVINNSESLAYVIYTSGTMGYPKGSLISQKSILRLVKNTNYMELNEDTVILQTGSIAFDASTLEIWGALLNGGKLVLCEDEVITSADLLEDYIVRYSVNTMWLTASLYNQMIQLNVSMFNSLKYLLIGGEKLSEKHVRMLKENNSKTILINGYGPTENTTFTATYEIPSEFETIYIGRPIANTQVYILNDNNLCGIGMPGQLCIAGDGVAKGYLNQPELTKKKFIHNPFGEGKLYLSGDLARWTLEGNIDFIGRMDSQVKIRGFRIELSEIETIVKDYELIDEACVLAKDNDQGEKEIYAYFTSKVQVSITKMKEGLRRLLPEYMIPSYMLQIDTMPLTIQGKVDKKALPHIYKKNEEKYVAPRNEAEQILCQVLMEVLGVEKIGIKDSYFALGGDSIKAIRVVSKMRLEGYEIAVKDIMMFYIVEVVAQAAKKITDTQDYNQDEVIGIVKPTPILNIFKSWNLARPEHFNQDILIDVDTSDVDIIEKSLEALVIHHDILRSIYLNDRLEIMPKTVNKGYELKVFDLNNQFFLSMEEECTKLQSSIRLESGPLMKAALFKCHSGHKLFICIHHLIIDSVSWQIILEDLSTAFNSLRKGIKIVFPKKTASYIEWANALEEYKSSKEIQSQKEYWRSVISEMCEGSLLIERLGNVSDYDTIEAELDENLTEQLTLYASKAFHTKTLDLLISALAMAVNRITGQEKLAIVMEGHGREELHKKIDVDRTVGWFTSMYPLVVSCMEEIQQTIVDTKETIRKIPNNGIGYGMLRETYPLPNSDITFNYLGQIDDGGKNNNSKFFQTGKSSADENKFLSGISIVGSIVHGNLVMKFNYDRADYKKEQLETLAQGYMEALQQIIKYCISRDESSKTVSDMYSEDIILEDLENINLFF